jgi:NAD(P) transhydrogenase subunit beta
LFASYQIAPAVGLGWILLGLVVGGGYGAWRAKSVE